jgi:hypothetical protein
MSNTEDPTDDLDDPRVINGSLQKILEAPDAA